MGETRERLGAARKSKQANKDAAIYAEIVIQLEK